MRMPEIKLKPCPFCGGEAATVFYTGYIYVSCENCGATSEMVKISEEYSATEKAAAEAWNRRVDNAKSNS